MRGGFSSCDTPFNLFTHILTDRAISLVSSQRRKHCSLPFSSLSARLLGLGSGHSFHESDYAACAGVVPHQLLETKTEEGIIPHSVFKKIKNALSARLVGKPRFAYALIDNV
jgi:hypothetical protein